MADLLRDFAQAAQRFPDRVAIVDGRGQPVSFAQLQQRADSFARAWEKRGIGKGDRVLLAMKLDADLYASLAALWSLGATVVLPEPAMGLGGLRHAAKVTGADAFCSSGAYSLLKYALPELWGLRHLRPSRHSGGPLEMTPPEPDDIALISFTSGTTGAPKAIPRSHGFLAAQHRAIAPLLDSTRDERDLVAFPVFVLINIASGRTSVLPNWKMSRLAKLDPDRLAAWISEQRITRALLPPSLCEKLAMTAIAPSLRVVFTGGGPVFPDILARMKAVKPDLQITCVYGSTEAEPIAHLHAAEIGADDLERMTQGHGLLVGQPVEELHIRVVEDEIQVAGAHVNVGYLDPRHDAENKIHEDGLIWHRTGDAGYLDATGRLWLLGRLGSEVMQPNGPVFPFGVEVAARSWPGVAQCALMAAEGGACLMIEGDREHLAEWQTKAAELNIQSVTPLDKIPMDKRHASKIDRAALKRFM